MDRFTWGAVATCVLAAGACAAEHTPDGPEVVKKNVKDGKAVLVDVREADEWKDGHLKDAKHLALSDLKKGVPGEQLKKSLPAGSIVYLHCGSGKRCLAAADILKKQGYDVRPLKEGYRDLLKNGFEQDK
ncbi:MAG: rhodanese-like domain-containing protein [Planctomycetes bacterium]|nr:rhodanese-like domain-containing protein [Planctomycetota bacterium]